MNRQYIQKTKNSGFTLIEIMISMVISSFVIAGIYGIYTIQQRSYTGQEQVAEMQQRARSALSVISSEIRMTGYAGTCKDKAGIKEAKTDGFSFSYCDDGSLVENTFRLYGAYGGTTIALGLERGNAPIEPVAEGVEAIEFRYLNNVGQVLAPPVSDTTLIRAVQVSLLVRSGYPDPKYTDTITYKPASVRDAEQNGGTAPVWDINGTANGTGNPPTSETCEKETDLCRYRRRLLITSIQLRNNI